MALVSAVRSAAYPELQCAPRSRPGFLMTFEAYAGAAIASRVSANASYRHSRESGNPLVLTPKSKWIPAFAGMTVFGASSRNATLVIPETPTRQRWQAAPLFLHWTFP